MREENLLIYVLIFIAGALTFSILSKLFGKSRGNNHGGQPSTINSRIIQQMVDNYRSKQLTAINQRLGAEDAHSVSFSLKILKKFIADIEYQTKKRDPRIGVDALGIRFYYAAYPNENEWGRFENENSIGKDYAQKHTLIMIPTLKKKIKNGSYLDYDFNPLDERSFVTSEIDVNQSVNMSVMSSDSSNSPSGEVMAQNHGQTIPPADSSVELY